MYHSCCPVSWDSHCLIMWLQPWSWSAARGHASGSRRTARAGRRGSWAAATTTTWALPAKKQQFKCSIKCKFAFSQLLQFYNDTFRFLHPKLDRNRERISNAYLHGKEHSCNFGSDPQSIWSTIDWVCKQKDHTIWHYKEQSFSSHLCFSLHPTVVCSKIRQPKLNLWLHECMKSC